ncbi:MAG: 30S ribosomal protein S16 [Acidimicrobiia bacterium]
MAVKIRLTRLGKKKQPTYRVVVMDSRKPRDGKYIEQLGIYDPRQEPSLVTIDNERALHWLKTGAQPTERAQKLLEISGAWTQFKVARGDIHTVGDDDSPKAAVHVVEDTSPEPSETPVETEATTDVVEEAATESSESSVEAEEEVAAVEAAPEETEDA